MVKSGGSPSVRGRRIKIAAKRAREPIAAGVFEDAIVVVGDTF